MNKAQAGMVLLKIKAAFPFFDLNDDTKALWIEKLMKSDDQTVLDNLDWWIENENKTPLISDIIKPFKTMSIYEHQQLEAEKDRLALKEYHENEDVKPMPDHIRDKLERLFAAKKVNRDEH